MMKKGIWTFTQRRESNLDDFFFVFVVVITTIWLIHVHCLEIPFGFFFVFFFSTFFMREKTDLPLRHRYNQPDGRRGLNNGPCPTLFLFFLLLNNNNHLFLFFFSFVVWPDSCCWLTNTNSWLESLKWKAQNNSLISLSLYNNITCRMKTAWIDWFDKWKKNKYIYIKVSLHPRKKEKKTWWFFLTFSHYVLLISWRT